MIIVYFARVLLNIIDIALLIRAVLSWVAPGKYNRFIHFIYLLSEPVILPFRKLFDKLNIGVNSPIDLPFLCAVLTVSFLLNVF